jgi:glycosyltransferase involved in cell wall biosynthesis
MYKLLIICDRPDWAFAKTANALQCGLKNAEVRIRYGSRVENLADHEAFDLIFYMLDYFPDMLLHFNIPREKFGLAIRSHVFEKVIPFYLKDGLLRERTGALFTANKTLTAVFSKLHSSVFYSPGGVDTDFFRPEKSPVIRERVVVGWAGSRANFGADHRGLGLIQEACKLAGYLFKPALREEKWRTPGEMRDYYNQEIDIYTDMSVSAGRQNGLIEAGACGKPLVSSDAGIAAELVRSGKNGIISGRTSIELADALTAAWENRVLFGSTVRADIEANWNWNTQLAFFEKGFDHLLQLQGKSNQGLLILP